MIEFIKKDLARQHNRSLTDGWEVCITTGSADGIAKAFDVLLDEGDSVLLENPTYP